jgi:hypothetical protein
MNLKEIQGETKFYFLSEDKTLCIGLTDETVRIYRLTGKKGLLGKLKDEYEESQVIWLSLRDRTFTKGDFVLDEYLGVLTYPELVNRVILEMLGIGYEEHKTLEKVQEYAKDATGKIKFDWDMDPVVEYKTEETTKYKLSRMPTEDELIATFNKILKMQEFFEKMYGPLKKLADGFKKIGICDYTIHDPSYLSSFKEKIDSGKEIKPNELAKMNLSILEDETRRIMSYKKHMRIDFHASAQNNLPKSFSLSPDRSRLTIQTMGGSEIIYEEKNGKYHETC